MLINIRYDSMYSDEKDSKVKGGITLMEDIDGELGPHFDTVKNEYE